MKRGLLIALVLVILSCCCVTLLGILGFAYFESNGNCTYKGPFSRPAGGACSQEVNTDDNSEKETANSNTKEYNAENFTFRYPDDMFITTANSIVYVYSNSNMQGNNLNIFSQEFNQNLNINSDYCDSYKVEFTKQLQNLGYTNLKLSNSGLDTIDGFNSCVVEYSGYYQGITVYQKQYVVEDTTNPGMVFYLTTSVFNQSNINDFDTIINSFQIK